MKIESNHGIAASKSGAATEPAAERQAEGPSAAAPDTSGDPQAVRRQAGLERSDEAALVQAALDAVADLPVVDADRVATLRAAIARGEYRIDAERIAERMIDAAAPDTSDTTERARARDEREY